VSTSSGAIFGDHAHAAGSVEAVNRTGSARRKIVIMRISANPPGTFKMMMCRFLRSMVHDLVGHAPSKSHADKMEHSDRTFKYCDAMST
jgi:hypothetical protein